MRLNEIALSPMINHLVRMCQQHLGFENIPPINIIDDQPSIEGKSFGYFDGQAVNVISMNRHPVDVCRTLAHELVHWHQMCAGEDMDGSDGSTTENDANAIAGKIMREFGRRFPEYFES